MMSAGRSLARLALGQGGSHAHPHTPTHTTPTHLPAASVPWGQNNTPPPGKMYFGATEMGKQVMVLAS